MEERGSFQPSVNESVYRGLQQRLHEIERILREDVTVNELTRAKNSENDNPLLLLLPLRGTDRIIR